MIMSRRSPPAAAATNRNLKKKKNRGISPVLHDSPHSPPSATASHPRLVGNGHTQACDRPECSRPRTRLYPAVSVVPRNGRSACHILSLWCDVVRGRRTEREAASRGAGPLGMVEPNESNQRIRSVRTAVSTCQTVYLYLQHIPGTNPNAPSLSANRCVCI